MERVYRDKRFRHIANDVRFMDVPRKESKVKVDKRFKNMFKDKNFNVKYTVDKRGRPQSYSTTEYLEKFYDVSSSSDSDEEEESDPEAEDDEVASDTDSNEQIPSETHEKLDCSTAEIVATRLSSGPMAEDGEETDDDKSVDYARGVGNVDTSSSDDGSSDDEEAEEIIHPWGEVDKDAQTTDVSTRRLAVCNMDWDVITAKCIMAILSSFAPMGKSIRSVKIYVSDYGRKQMEFERLSGPACKKKAKQLKIDAKAKGAGFHPDGEQFHPELVRQYEIDRLRYYYAIVDCEDVNTADAIYQKCDAVEIRASSVKIDLRYIPDDMVFTEEPCDVADSSIDISRYRPKLLPSKCFEGSSVKLSWDETNPYRTYSMTKAFQQQEDYGEFEDQDVMQYLGSASSDDENDSEMGEKDCTSDIKEADERSSKDEAPEGKTAGEVVIGGKKTTKGERDKLIEYKELLKGIEDGERRKEQRTPCLEVTWDVGLQEKAEALVKQKIQETEWEQMTPWEQLLKQRAETRRQKKEMKRHKRAENDDDDDTENSDRELDPGSELLANDTLAGNPTSNVADSSSGKKPKVKKNQVSNTVKLNASEQAAMELLVMDDKDDNKQHFSLKKLILSEKEFKKRKSGKIEKSKEQDYFQVNVDDSRFGAVYNSHLYHIDPSDYHFRKTEGMLSIVDEKLRRINERGKRPADSLQTKFDDDNESGVSGQRNLSNSKVEMAMLVKSLKNRVANTKANKRLKK